jgi:hypothetical protein
LKSFGRFLQKLGGIVYYDYYLNGKPSDFMPSFGVYLTDSGGGVHDDCRN